VVVQKKREEGKISESHKHRERKKKGGKKHRNLHHHRVSRSPSPRSRKEEKKKNNNNNNNNNKKLDPGEKKFGSSHIYPPLLLHGFQKFGKNKNNTNNASHPKKRTIDRDRVTRYPRRLAIVCILGVSL